MGSSVMSWERQENTAWSVSPCTVEQRTKVLWIPSALSMCWAGGDTKLVLSQSFCPLCAAAQKGGTARVSSVCLELQALRNAGQGWVTEQDVNLPRG